MKRWNDFLDNHPKFASVLREVRAYLPPLNFITLHYGYFVIVCLISSIIFWGSSDPKHSISYVDSLFLVVSAMTEAGLNTVNLSTMTSWQQVILWLLIILGSSVWVSIWTVVARKSAFEKRFDDIVQMERNRRLERRNTALPIMQRVRTFSRSRSEQLSTERLSTMGSRRAESSRDGRNEEGAELGVGTAAKRAIATTRSPPGEEASGGAREGVDKSIKDTVLTQSEEETIQEHITFADEAMARTSGAAVDPEKGLTRRPRTKGDGESEHKLRSDHVRFLSERKVGRNGQFFDLTSEEREQLGGAEYRALRLLSVVVPIYFVLWQLLAALGLGAWMAVNRPDVSLSNGINPWWTGVFNAISAFNNSGMSVLDENAMPFADSYYVLITMALCILAGNTAYPIFLRLVLWTMLKVLKKFTYEHDYCDWKDTLEYILKYPRRVYTNLFPSRHTWWLLAMIVLLNGIDWVGFEILNLGNSNLEQVSLGSRVMDGLFQAIAVRSGGFYVVSIPSLYIGLQVLYVIMMYVSVYPVVITMRHSNVYEERSLGIYANDPTPRESGPRHGTRPRPHRRSSGQGNVLSKALRRALTDWQGVGAAANQNPDDHESRVSFVGHQLRSQLAHDLWWLVLAVFLITVIETSHFIDDPVTYSVFNVLFEVVSGYGCVGISVGLPDAAYSFSGGWHAGSKLVLCAVMLRGRHRGLPVALDRAVRLPGDHLEREEEEDQRIRRSMSARRQSFDVAVGE